MKQDFVKQPKTRLVNIYLTEVTQNNLKEIMNQYHVSLSAMITIACELDIIESCNKVEFFDKSHCIRTVIKPRYFRQHPQEDRSKETLIASNLAYLITCKFWLPVYSEIAMKKLALSKDRQEETKKVYKELANRNWNKFISACQKENEKFWDYNARYRATVRARKQYEREYGNN